MALMTIGEFAGRVGLRTSAIRYYERKGLLPAPKRVNGRRRYDAGDLRQVAFIQIARQAGFGISEIQRLVGDFPEQTTPSERWASLARQKLADLDALMAQIQGMKTVLERGLDCECEALETCETVGRVVAGYAN